jgi:hypothetical protein
MSLTILMLNHNYFCEQLRARGHRVIIGLEVSRHRAAVTAKGVQSNADITFEDSIALPKLLERISGCSIDRIVLHDESRDLRIWDLEKALVPTLFYSIDCHIHSWHGIAAGLVDRAFFAQKDYAAQFLSWNQNSEWLPLWAPSIPAESSDEQRSIRVCFRGNLDPAARPKRVKFFEQLAKRVPLDARAGPWEEAYPRAQIVVNDNSAGDLNFRVFESLASGAMLVTARIQNGLGELFQEGVHYAGYEEGNVEEAAAAIQRYLGNPEERMRIASAARKIVMAKHSADARASSFVSAVEICERGLRPQGAAASSYLRTFSASLAYPRQLAQSEEQILSAIEDVLSISSETIPLETLYAISSIVCSLQKSDGAALALNLLQLLRQRHPASEVVRWLLIDGYWKAGAHKKVEEILGEPLPQQQAELNEGLQRVALFTSRALAMAPLSAQFLAFLKPRLE